MSNDPQLSLQMQALLNRLQARLGSGLADAAASLMAAAETAPAKLNQEWQLFWQEVELEAQRLEQNGDSDGGSGDETSCEPDTAAAASPASTDPQELIDHLRARVATLSHKLDA